MSGTAKTRRKDSNVKCCQRPVEPIHPTHGLMTLACMAPKVGGDTLVIKNERERNKKLKMRETEK